MTPTALITTSILLGLFVLAGGGYGGLYCVARLKGLRTCLVAAYGCYAAQALLVLAILWLTPLASEWKFFIVLSGAAYAVIPPITWQYLDQLHQPENRLDHS